MNIKITRSENIPIYKQIKNNIKDSILNNKFKEGDLLPSIRFLSNKLKISILTVRRAYDELESEGFIISQRGRGSFVTLKNVDSLKDTKLKIIEDMLMEVFDVSKSIGISKEDLCFVVNILFDEAENEYVKKHKSIDKT